MNQNEFRDFILSKASLFLLGYGTLERFSESSWRELEKAINQFVEEYPHDIEHSLLFNFLENIDELCEASSRQHQDAIAQKKYENLRQILYSESTE